jgi:hypothetical protein
MLQRLTLFLLLRNPHIQHRNTHPPHPIHLRDNLAQPRSAARDDHNLALPVEFPRGTPCQPLVEFTQNGEEGDEGGVEACVLEVRVGGWVGEGAQAERDQPSDVGVEEGAGEDVG